MNKLSGGKGELQFLGQAGVRLRADSADLLIDPYLSNSVGETYGAGVNRRCPVPVAPNELSGVDWVLLTHAHLDHTDPATLRPLAAASPQARFLAPYESREILQTLGISPERIARPSSRWTELAPGLRVRSIPAAHPQLEKNEAGEFRYVGYLLDANGTRIYHAGDTSPHDEIFANLADEAVDLALLPVNERNFYRDRADIVGNMTLREAFQMTVDIKARVLVPLHWDMFAPNAVHQEEMELLFTLENPPFELRLLRCGETLALPKLS